MNQDITIGITGGIGSGKSVVSRILRCNGFRIYDCDSMAKCLMENEADVKNALISAFGRFVFTDEGKINRKELAHIIFTDDSARFFVNSIVHEAVRKDIYNKRSNYVGRFFIESAILATSGLDVLCDWIWWVKAPYGVRIERVVNRDKTDPVQIENRMKTQEEEFAFLDSDKIIELENGGNFALLPAVLKYSEKYIINQIYTISC